MRAKVKCLVRGQFPLIVAPSLREHARALGADLGMVARPQPLPRNGVSVGEKGRMMGQGLAHAGLPSRNHLLRGLKCIGRAQDSNRRASGK